MPRAWPIEPATETARAPRPASRIKQATAGLLARGSFACRRLPRAHPSGQLRQAFRLQLRGQLRNSGETRHRIPFSLLIFEETVNSASLKGLGAGLVNGDALPRRIGLAAAKVQSIVPTVVGSRMRHAGRKTGTR